MSKLEELGGLEGLRKKLSSMGSWSEKQSLAIDALMSEIESLTTERDTLKKRVEELGVGFTKACAANGDKMVVIKKLKSQLQAARELAQMVISDKCWDDIDYTTSLVTRSREFLKLLEGE